MHFRLLRLTAALALGVFALPLPAAAQQQGESQSPTPSLVELAKPPKNAKPHKVYTDKDLKRPSDDAAATTPAPATDAKPEAEAAEAKPAEAKPAADATPAKVDPAAEAAKDEAYWHGRITAARESVQKNEMFHEALQSRINALTTDFTNRDDPAQRALIGDDRQKALAELNRLVQEITSGKKQIADIEEEARRAGVPAGWIR